MSNRVSVIKVGAESKADESNKRGKNNASRRSRTRAATRQKLIDAALIVVAQKGFEAANISDITEEADVGVGSFYNHFGSKDELALAVFASRAEQLALINDAIAEREEDAALVIVYILRLFFTKVVSDPVWGWFLVHASNSLPETARIFMMRARRDIGRGVGEGRFVDVQDETAVRIMMSAMLAIMRQILEDQAGDSVVEETIEYFLRMLGVERQEAKLLSQKEIPQYVTDALKG